MKLTKKVIFKINGQEVDTINGDDIDLRELENLKIQIAFAHSVSVHDIEMDTIDEVVRELSKHTYISKDGLFFKPKNDYAIFTAVKSISPSFEIKSEDGFQKFLDLITAKDFDNAITFN